MPSKVSQNENVQHPDQMPATLPPYFDARYQLDNDIPGGASGSAFQSPYLVKKHNHALLC